MLGLTVVGWVVDDEISEKSGLAIEDAGRKEEVKKKKIVVASLMWL